jgi:hypothetical protein
MNRSPSPNFQEGFMKKSTGSSSPREAIGADSKGDDRISSDDLVHSPMLNAFPYPTPSASLQQRAKQHDVGHLKKHWVMTAGNHSKPSSSEKRSSHEQPGIANQGATLTSDSLAVSAAMEETPLPKDFKPSEFTVIIGRGKKIRESIGNIHLRTLATTYLPQYADAMKNRQAKTEVVNNVLSIIRAVCPNGGAFVRCDKGQWYEVSDRVAREKVGYCFRDLLSDSSYESSCKSKTAKRKRQQQKLEKELLIDTGVEDANLLMQEGSAICRQQPMSVPSVASLFSSGRIEYQIHPQRDVKRSFSDSEYRSSNSEISLHRKRQPSAMPLANFQQHHPFTDATSPSQAHLQSRSMPLPQPMMQLLQQQNRLQQDQLWSYSTAMQYRNFGSNGINLDPLNMFTGPRRSSGFTHEYSDFSEASTASELDDSIQNPDSARSSRSAPGALSGGLSGHLMRQSSHSNVNESLNLLTSPLLECHIERANERDSSSD